MNKVHLYANGVDVFPRSPLQIITDGSSQSMEIKAPVAPHNHACVSFIDEENRMTGHTRDCVGVGIWGGGVLSKPEDWFVASW